MADEVEQSEKRKREKEKKIVVILVCLVNGRECLIDSSPWLEILGYLGCVRL